jgi:hypothetical protein
LLDVIKDFRHAERSAQARRRSRPNVQMRRALRRLEPRLIKYVRTEGDCWVWTGSLTGSGQPVLRIGPDHRLTPVRRFLFEHVHGPISSSRRAKSLKSCHAHCVRPSHTTVKGDAKRSA